MEVQVTVHIDREYADAEARELRRRVVLSRTPAVCTEDALTVAKLHDAVCAYVRARDELPFPPSYNGDERSFQQRLTGYHAAMARLKDALRVLRIVAGADPDF